MATGDLVTTNWEGEYQAFAFGGDSDYSITQINGIVGLPDISSGARRRLLRNGMQPADDFLLSRTITLSLELYGADDTTLNTNVQAFLLAFRPGESEAALVLQIPGIANGNKFLLWCRPRNRFAPVGMEWYHRVPLVDVELVATDPRLYAATESSTGSTLPTAAGGMQFNEVPNITFGAAASGGSDQLTNAGTFKTSPVLKIVGPITDPIVTNTTTDKIFAWQGTVAAGTFLLVDMNNRTVLLNGTASRYNGLTASSQFWDLEPGVNDITFRAAAFTAATLTTTWRSAWV